MFLRHKIRRKDGKEHRYWSIVENRRVSGGRTVQRHVLYLGEINDSQRAAWCQTIEAFDESGERTGQIALFPEDRSAPALDCDVVHVRLSGLRLRRPRQWGACWLACYLWDQLQLDEFWSPRLPASRQGTRWLNVLKTLVVYRLIDPGSEWRLHRQWYEQSAMALCWTRSSAWSQKIICTGASTSCWHARRSCSAFCKSAGKRCSTLSSRCCCMT